MLCYLGVIGYVWMKIVIIGVGVCKEIGIDLFLFMILKMLLYGSEIVM